MCRDAGAYSRERLEWKGVEVVTIGMRVRMEWSQLEGRGKTGQDRTGHKHQRERKRNWRRKTKVDR